MILWIILIFCSIDLGLSVEVHFESADSGFFLKHPNRHGQSSVPDLLSGSTKNKNSDSTLSIDRFTVVQTTQPVSIRASYGPFSTKQTVPARYIIPDNTDTQGDHSMNASAALLELQQANIHLDISAHVVRNSIPRDSPVLRVLFHAGADPGGHLQRQKICVLLHVAMGSRQPLKGRCIPEGEDGVCVAEVVIPSNWWPSLPPPEKDIHTGLPIKVPLRSVQVSYSVFEPPLRNPEACEPKVQIQPLTTFAQVPLVNAIHPYKDLRADEYLTILIPQTPLYPMSKIHVPVFLHQQPHQNIAVFIVRARVKSGMKILGATSSSDFWNISIEKENPKHTIARVTALRKDQDPDNISKADETFNSDKVTEIFSWLLEVANDTRENWDGGKIVWSVNYVYDGPKMRDSPESTGQTPEESRRKLIAKLEINKDDIQAILPISKNWELMNTAVLTARQVSQTMKVFIVSQAGKVADVTTQSTCHAEDESVIKVSSSCSSVYVDGSEIRGSSNASIVVKYGTYTGMAKFIVWMPEFPLEVGVADFRLSQIKGWRIPEDHHFNNIKAQTKRKKRSYGWNNHEDVFTSEKSTCRARFQQSPIEVYARFLATDQNSGKVSYLISRKNGLRVTDLVQPLLRIADPKIASLKGRILQGKSIGRTDVQVLSPVNGRVIGSKEIRVGSDKVSLTHLIVRVVSGLQLTITPDSSIENGYVAETSVTRRLTAQYQEGLLDIDLEFSDGSKTPLRDVTHDDYFLHVESLDTDVVAFAPMLASHHPRVIAVGEGNGDLLRVTLFVSDECRSRRGLLLGKQSKQGQVPLSSAVASVQVDFNGETPTKPDSVQNDGVIGRGKSYRDKSDLGDIIVGIPLRDDSKYYEPTVQARQHRGSINSLEGHRHKPEFHFKNMSTMEIGMYVILTVFCFAIIIFVISCVVYASKFRPITIESGLDPRDIETSKSSMASKDLKPSKVSTTNAHDWVWLGRSTMDRNSINQELGTTCENMNDSKIRITSNPLIVYNQSDVKINSLQVDRHEYLNTATFIKNNSLISSSPPPIPPHTNHPNTKVDYRPPVPPHRNIGVTANGPTGNSVSKKHNHKHRRNFSQSPINQNNTKSQTKPNELIRCSTDSFYKPLPQKKIDSIIIANGTGAEQCKGSSAKKTDSLHVSLVSQENDIELHMAEKLVESPTWNNAFKFDTITRKQNGSQDIQIIAVDKVNKHIERNQTQQNSMDSKDNGGFVTPPLDNTISRRTQVKRATIVGNPMFFNSLHNELCNTDSLGLDDLDMDYEQIMHYFDNLKESNA
ncbi:TMEM132E family protein [Megaselia abdita]